MPMKFPVDDDALSSTVSDLDATDPLRDFPGSFFVTDPDVCYLDGNSLGRVPTATIDRVNTFLRDEWGTWLVDGWSRWIDLAQVAGDQLAQTCLGTGPGQTLVVDTTSVNLYQLAGAVVRQARDTRRTIIVDSANFPTDRYIMQGIADQQGYELVTLNTDGTGGPGQVDVDVEHERLTAAALEPFLDDTVALLTLQAVNYRSGARSEIAAINALAKKHGIPVIWDCSHAVGSIALEFDKNGVDLAVGCTYKYLNAGPGSPGWLFVRDTWQEELQVPVQGWFAQADQFAMGPFFEPDASMRKFQIASPSIIGIRMVEESLAMIGEAGIHEIEKKAAQGTELMVHLWREWLEPLGFGLVTPLDPAHRGGHITLTHPEAKQIAQAMRELIKVIPDYREPATIRVAISPLATTYREVFEGLGRLKTLVESGDYRSVSVSGSRVT
jgi:kynureninase